MNVRKALFGVIIFASLFFIGVMIFGTNQFVKTAHANADYYLSNKQILVAGTIENFEKVSGQNKLVEINPSHFENNILDTKNSIGFYFSDTTKVFAVLYFPDDLTIADSLSTTAQTTTFFKNNTIIGTEKPQLMRWATVQNLKVTYEKNRNLNLEYLN